MSRPFPIAKRGVRFFIDADAKCPLMGRPADWYLQWWTRKYKRWEDRTFIIFDTFLRESGSLIDVGAWIGPTVLYAAAFAKHVYCFEPDPEAHRVLLLNLSVNPQYRNVTVLNATLSDNDGEVVLTNRAGFGDSESTIMLESLARGESPMMTTPEDRSGAQEQPEFATLRVPAMTISTFEQRYTVAGCSLMKIDIEGGEKIVVPMLEGFLRRHRPPLYLSLHWMRLTEAEIKSLFDLLSSIYDFIYDDSLLRRVDRNRLGREKISSLVCTSAPLSPLQLMRVGGMSVRGWFRAAARMARRSIHSPPASHTGQLTNV